MSTPLQRSYIYGNVRARKIGLIKTEVILNFNNASIENFIFSNNSIEDLLKVRANVSIQTLKNSNLQELYDNGFVEIIEPAIDKDYLVIDDSKMRHNTLHNRNAENSHSVSSVSNLQNIFNEKAAFVHNHECDNIDGLLEYIIDNPGSIISKHNDLLGIDAVDCHPIGSVTSLDSTLANKALTSHTHIINNVTSLQDTLDDKSDTVHSHIIGDVTNLQTALNDKAALVHSHTIANVTGLQTAIDSKIANATNLGSSGATLFAQKTGTILDLRKLKAGTNCSITSDASYVKIGKTGTTGSLYLFATGNNTVYSFSNGTRMLFPHITSVNGLTMEPAGDIFNLIGGHTYYIETNWCFYQTTDGAEAVVATVLYNETTSSEISTGIGTALFSPSNWGGDANSTAKLSNGHWFFSPSVYTQVSFKSIYATGNVQSYIPSECYLFITQIQ